MHRHWATITLIALLATPKLHAVEISSGTAQFLSARDCIPGVTACDGVSAPTFSQFGGLPGDAISMAAISPVGYGSASGSVSLSGIAGAPILRSSASSEPGTRINTTSVALQRYVYDGLVPTTRVFGGTLTYSTFSTGNYPLGLAGGVIAGLQIFTLPTSTIFVEPTRAANFNMLFLEYQFLPGFVDLGFDSFQDSTTNPNGSVTLGVPVLLNPGDAIWIRAILQTPAVNGGWVDSSNTLITAWDDSTNLVPAVIAIPEPSKALLSIFGLMAILGFAMARQRRNTNLLVSNAVAH